MVATVNSGAPRPVRLGTQDNSIPRAQPFPENLPTHLPLVYIYAKEGPEGEQLLGGADAASTYHADTFDPRKRWFNHSTLFANTFIGNANLVHICRVKPEDAPPPATIRMYMDVLPIKLPLYQRNDDGSFKKDAVGNRIPENGNQKVDGFRVKFVIAKIDQVNGVSDFGVGTIMAGDQTDPDTNAQSQRYPIYDAEISSFGDHGNNKALSIWTAHRASDIPVNEDIITKNKAYPFNLAFLSRTDNKSTPTNVPTNSAAEFETFTLKQGVIDQYDVPRYASSTDVINNWQVLDDPDVTRRYSPFGKFKLYDANIATLITQFYNAEKLHPVLNYSDFTGEDGEEYVFNMLGGHSSYNVLYNTFDIVTGGADSVVLNQATRIYARGGGDGTMNNAAFAASVEKLIARYGNDYDQRSDDTARFPESIFYDSGFPLETKKVLLNFISRRKDLKLCLCTHVAGGPALTATEESSMALALRTRARIYPESEYFGTPVMRCTIVGRSGVLINSQWKERTPVLLEIAQKASKYMGASNGRWKTEFNFDHGVNAKITMFKDINIIWTPLSVRNKDWANGLNWVASYSYRENYIPALKTVYDDDRSVLTSFFTAIAICELQKIGERAHREFSGQSSLTNEQLIEGVEKFVNVAVNRIGFDNRFIITPVCSISSFDAYSGYSWTLRINIEANNMKTVQFTYVAASRISDRQTN